MRDYRRSHEAGQEACAGDSAGRCEEPATAGVEGPVACRVEQVKFHFGAFGSLTRTGVVRRGEGLVAFLTPAPTLCARENMEAPRGVLF